MSVDINWHTLTEGTDGQELAEKIRAFIHDRFQQIPLPRLIRSVKVQGFDFGDVAPQVELKDICEPLPDFYENDEDEGIGDSTQALEERDQSTPHDGAASHLKAGRDKMKAANRPRHSTITKSQDLSSNTPLQGTATPGFLHGTSNLGYFHLPLSAGLSGTNTPLAAVAGAHFAQGAPPNEATHHNSDSLSSISPPPTLTPPSRPTSRDESFLDQRRSSLLLDDDGDGSSIHHPPSVEPDRSSEDLQIVFHVSYSGDVKLSMTADVFLDYPMPSFVGIPLKLNITGITFDGVGVIAYIKRKAHVCFLAPEDAEALIGGESTDLHSPNETPTPTPAQEQAEKQQKVGGLIENIKIESEMGEAEGGKQVLKNVGKIEKFILEQVQKIFEEEFVYPSFWTFLV